MTDDAAPAVGDLIDMVVAIDHQAVDELVEAIGPDMDGLAAFLAQLRRAQAVFAAIDTDVCRTLVELIPFGAEPDVTGVGRLKVTRPGKRKRHDHRAIIQRLTAAMADELACDRTTGEARPPVAIIEEAVEIMCAATGATAPSFDGWRAGVLKDRGIALAAFTEYLDSDRPLTVKIS